MEITPSPESCCPSYRRRDLEDGVCPHCGHDHRGADYVDG